MEKLFSTPIKVVAKKSTKDIIIEYFQKNNHRYENKCLCIIPEFPLTTNKNKHVKFLSTYISTPSMTIIRNIKPNSIDITYDVYKIVYNSKLSTIYTNVHDAIYAFYDWYANLITTPNIDLDNILMALEDHEQINMVYNCNFGDIYKLLFSKFSEFSDGVDANESMIKEINAFKSFIIHYEKFKKLETLKAI